MQTNIFHYSIKLFVFLKIKILFYFKRINCFVDFCPNLILDTNICCCCCCRKGCYWFCYWCYCCSCSCSCFFYCCCILLYIVVDIVVTIVVAVVGGVVQETISQSAVETKFARHSTNGRLITRDLHAVMEGISDSAVASRYQHSTAWYILTQNITLGLQLFCSFFNKCICSYQKYFLILFC